jgi:hypothetical protein
MCPEQLASYCYPCLHFVISSSIFDSQCFLSSCREDCEFLIVTLGGANSKWTGAWNCTFCVLLSKPSHTSIWASHILCWQLCAHATLSCCRYLPTLVHGGSCVISLSILLYLCRKCLQMALPLLTCFCLRTKVTLNNLWFNVWLGSIHSTGILAPSHLLNGNCI